jgi:hypothetical protein
LKKQYCKHQTKLHSENNNRFQVYNSETNNYYYFNKDKTAQKFEGSMQTSEKFVVTKIDRKEIVAGKWNKYLEATNGTISLKHVVIDLKNGFIWTSTATEISKQELTNKDFEFPTDFKLDN